MKKTIDNKIKAFYKTKVNFAKETGVAPADLTRKLKSLHTKITWVNEIIKPLNFELQLGNIDTEIHCVNTVIVVKYLVNNKLAVVTVSPSGTVIKNEKHGIFTDKETKDLDAHLKAIYNG